MHKGANERKGVYLVTDGDLRMTDSSVLDSGGMSSMESGAVTSSLGVIFRDEKTAAFISAADHNLDEMILIRTL